jgi:hypothetical protein
MDFNATVDLIIKDLEEARIIIDDLKNYPGVPLLQVEMAKSKCKSAADVIALLKDIQGRTTPETVKETSHEPPVNEVTPAEEVKPQIHEPQVISVNTQDASEQEIQETHDKIPEIKKEELPKAREKKHESSIIADTFSVSSDNLNERLGIKREADEYSDLIKSKPVKSLGEAIGVNDKFLFIREIFNGNPEAYEQAVAKLDNAENLAAAKEIINGYIEDTQESRVTRQFIDLLKRKFPSDE